MWQEKLPQEHHGLHRKLVTRNDQALEQHHKEVGLLECCAHLIEGEPLLVAHPPGQGRLLQPHGEGVGVEEEGVIHCWMCVVVLVL